MSKAISTVIATLLMLIITIALVGFSYSFITSFVGSKTGGIFSVVDTYKDSLTISNDGTDSISKIKAILDGSPVELGFELKKVQLGTAYNAAQAEDYCKTNFGSTWRLYVPSSSLDLSYGWVTAHSGADQSDDYLRILGIYPKAAGNTCTNIAFTSETCTGWRANDNGKFWVSTRTDIVEPNGDNCLTGSMGYFWNSDGTVNGYNDNVCPGLTSTRFICEKSQIEPGGSSTIKVLGQLTPGTHTVRLCTATACVTVVLSMN